MKNLIEALEAKHPGSKVIDIRFSLEPGVDEVVIDEQMDQELAVAVREAVEVDIRDVFG